MCPFGDPIPKPRPDCRTNRRHGTLVPVSSTADPISTPGGATHEVTNQPPPFEDYNAFDADPALGEALKRDGGSWGLDRVRDLGELVASAEAQEHSRRATRNLPP